jgi:putative membrane protein
MSFLAKVLVHIIANCAAILVAERLIPGFVFWGNWQDLIIAGAVLGIVNSLIRPVLKLLAFPLILITLGLFSVVINIFLLLLVSHFLPTLQIDGFWSAFWGVIIISIVNNIILSIFKPNDKDN